MAFVRSAGARIFWKEIGSGPPVLLIMGMSFAHEMWFRILPALSESYRTILFDNRGMGQSDVPTGPYRMVQMAQDAVAVMEAAGVESAHVIGASMGGMIAQELGLGHPGRIRSLTLACTSYAGLFARWPDLSYRPRNFGWGEESREQREAAFTPLLYAPGTAPELIAEDLKVRCQCGWSNKGFVNQLAGILLWNSYRRLPRINAPTLVVHGDQDRLVPPENGRVIAARIPNARFELIPNAGHVMATDQPEICVAIMRRFLAECSAGPAGKLA